MDPGGLHVRLVAPADRLALASFVCTSADPRIEPWIRSAADSQLASSPDDDLRVLVFHEDFGTLVAIAAHHRNQVLVVGPGRDLLAGS